MPHAFFSRPKILLSTLTAFMLALGAGGCSDDTSHGSPGAGGSGGTTGQGAQSAGGGGENSFSTGTSMGQTLTIEPQDPVLNVTGTPATVALTAKLDDGTVPSNLLWEVDDVVVGTIDAGGTFASGGFVAGVATVTAKSGTLTATTHVTVKVHIVDNAGGLSQSDQDTLTQGGAADPSFKWLYPYDQTVFPGGLRAPVPQFGGGGADALYLKVETDDFLYEGFFGPSTPARAPLTQQIWGAITKSAKAGVPVTVSATKLSGGQATGPEEASWNIAKGDFRGSIYYNTYKSALTSTGAVMRVRPDVDAEVLAGGCTVCHSVSANGNVLAGGVNWTNGNPLDSSTFDLAADGTIATRDLDDDGRKFAFGAMTPNGELLFSNGVPASGSPIRGLGGSYPSKLYDTATGALVDAPSLSVTYALTPSFAPDGTKIAFNWYDSGGGKTLATMTFDGSQSPPVFGAPELLVTADSAIAGWPSFLPDAEAVLFHDGDAFDTAQYGGGPRYAELRLVDVPTQTVSDLHALNGRDASGASYLPYGESEENNLDYEPTVLPIAVGGYYWVVFTSRRAYGNTIAPGGTVAGGGDKWGGIFNGVETPSVRKKLWVAAIDIDYAGKEDPSHPAFYLGEQELEAGNMRAFVALDPCKEDGNPCESGAQCCNGFCQPTGEVDENGNPVLACGSSGGGCSGIDEACTTASDCCDADALCINGFCALPPPS